jgi:hypothetical protein
LVDRIEAEGVLARDIEPALAADLLWALTSQQSCELLVQTRGWSATTLAEQLTRLLERGIMQPKHRASRRRQ